MDNETQRQFIARTYSQATRLTSLLQDISMLNRIDYAPDQLTKERIDLSHLVSDIVLETSLKLQQHRIILRNCLPGVIVISGNTSLLYSVFRNLIDNAVNYAGDGCTIEMTAKEQANRWLFTFSDNGPGIPKDQMTRIFERFYRIDKGRSRSLGGTGLGLAIVKNAIMLHGGTIKAQSAAPHGLRFVFTLKK
jgi:signal transduction histidine kinase